MHATNPQTSIYGNNFIKLVKCLAGTTSDGDRTAHLFINSASPSMTQYSEILKFITVHEMK